MCLSCNPNDYTDGLDITAADVLHDPIERPTPVGTLDQLLEVLGVRVALERAGIPAGPIYVISADTIVVESAHLPADTRAALEPRWQTAERHDGAVLVRTP